MRWQFPLSLAVTFALAFVAGAPANVGPLMLLSLAPMLFLLDGATVRQALVRGWLAGGAVQLALFHWIAPLMTRFGHVPAPLAAPLFALVLAWQAAPLGFVAAGVAHARARANLPPVVTLPALLVAAELLWAPLFPWHVGFPLARTTVLVQAADLFGQGVASALVAIVSASAHAAVRARAWRPVLPAAVALALDLGYGAVRMRQIDARRAAAPRLRVGIVQPNFAPSPSEAPRGERRADRAERLREATAAVVARGPDVVLWPESAYPYTLGRWHDRDFPDGDARRVGRYGVPVLLCTKTAGDDEWEYNTVVQVDPDGRFAARYDKQELMPFGETLPAYTLLAPLWDRLPNAGQLRRGREPGVFEIWSARLGARKGVLRAPAQGSSEAGALQDVAGGARLGALICVEDMVPRVGRALARRDVELLVNFTDDAWFGTSNAAWHHLENSIFRAIELRRDLVRAVMTGVSAHVDATGRVRMAGPLRDAAERHAPDTFVIEAARLSGRTLAVYVADALPWMCVALSILALTWRPRR